MQTQTAKSPANRARSRLLRWTTRDLLVMAAIAIVLAVVLAGANYLNAALMAINPMLIAILAGLYFLGSLMVMLIVRRPGACVLTRVIIGLASIPFTPWGWADLLMAAFYGVVCEVPFAVTRYRTYSMLISCLAGAFAGLLSYAGMALFGMFVVAPLAHVVTAIGFVVSGAALGGWLAQALVRAVAKTGVLNSFAVGQAQREEI